MFIPPLLHPTIPPRTPSLSAHLTGMDTIANSQKETTYNQRSSLQFFWGDNQENCDVIDPSSQQKNNRTNRRLDVELHRLVLIAKILKVLYFNNIARQQELCNHYPILYQTT